MNRPALAALGVLAMVVTGCSGPESGEVDGHRYSPAQTQLITHRTKSAYVLAVIGHAALLDTKQQIPYEHS